MLENHPNYCFFEMGQKLRDFAHMDEDLSPTVKEHLNAGKLVPLEVIEAMLTHYKKNHSGWTVIFDGIPRTRAQLDMFERVFNEYFVIFLDLDKEEALERLANRRVDPVTGQSFGADFIGDFSPFTGNKLIKRHDDNEAAVLKRIEAFYHNTLPLIVEWAERGKRVYRIDSSKSIDEVYSTIESILSAYGWYEELEESLKQ